jgi:hypothetical protein
MDTIFLGIILDLRIAVGTSSFAIDRRSVLY